MSRRGLVILTLVMLLVGATIGPALMGTAYAIVTCTVPNVFAGLSGNVSVALIDQDFTALNNCINTAALFTDLPLTRVFTGTQRWAKGANLTAAATLTLGSDGNYFTVAGNTPITAFSSYEAGTLITLTFTGTPTLTHNATTLILCGATTAQIAAGDVYVFVSEGGGNWREVWRRPVTNATTSNFLRGDCTWSAPASVSAFTTQTVVTGSRALNTTYQNTSGVTKFVAVSVCANVAGNAHISVLLTDAATPPTTTVARSTDTDGVGTVPGCGVLSAMVLNNNYYRVNESSSGVLSAWTEWQ